MCLIQSLTYAQLQASGFDFNADFYYRLNGGERGRLMGIEGICVAFYGVIEENDRLHVSYLFVQPAYRGQGYARRLLEEAYALAERERWAFYFRIRYDNPFADFLQRFRRGAWDGALCARPPFADQSRTDATSLARGAWCPPFRPDEGAGGSLGGKGCPNGKLREASEIRSRAVAAGLGDGRAVRTVAG